ncbi:MAG: Lrp/AsnC family transcriptional regulator [Clostridia bacterium]|nr:Lrp/AsnC family transcriptional regulator [Clostridia bacterium]
MLDQTDKKIIACLKQNSRMNASAIGAEVGMSVSAVIERIKKLESAGIIKKYTVVLDSEKIGLDVCAFIEVGGEHQKYAESHLQVQEYAAQNQQIVECHVITGSSMFILKVVTGSMRDLERILGELQHLSGVTYTRTSIVLSTFKNDLGPSADILTVEP